MLLKKLADLEIVLSNVYGDNNTIIIENDCELKGLNNFGAQMDPKIFIKRNVHIVDRYSYCKYRRKAKLKLVSDVCLRQIQ